MAYNQNIPLSTDKLSSSQVDLYNNFQAINAWVSVDHVPFSNTAQQGEHNRVFFVKQAADVATPTTTDSVLYTKTGTGGTTNLFFRGPSNATPLEISYALKAASGYTTLPSGIIIQWGTGTLPNSGSTKASINVSLAQAFPNSVLSVQVTPTTAVGSSSTTDWILSAAAASNSVITVKRSPNHTSVAVSFNFLVIGY